MDRREETSSIERTLDLSTAMDAPTPLWDNLLEKQLGKRSKCSGCGTVTMFTHDEALYCADCKEDGETVGESSPLMMCDMLEVLLGRLFYPIGKYDNWQVIFYT